MKNIFRIFVTGILLTIVYGCGKYTDIDPKGKNLLNKVEDLDLLMNYTYTGNAFNFNNQSILINDIYPSFTNIPNLVAAGVKDLRYAALTYDESINRKALTLTDASYEGLYSIITNVANIALTNVDNASGDAALGRQIKAEAYIIRAYMHYLLVNIYAKAYDASTAATDGGVPYVKDLNLEQVNAKNTVKEVYDYILADIDAALNLNSLPDHGKNSMRVGKSFAYGFKSRVMLSVGNFQEALIAANEGLKYNNVLEDHRVFLPAPAGSEQPFKRDGTSAPDNLFYMYFGKVFPTTFSPSIEIVNNYWESGNIIKNLPTAYNYSLSSFMGIPGVPIMLPTSGNYEQNMAGMTVSDLYLVKAESLIRTGKISEGMDIVNYVRELRNNPYVAATATTEAEAMGWLKRTSRVEFLYAIQNFINIKRWNAEGTYKEDIVKEIAGIKYTLKPDSKLWISPFPQSATDFNKTLTQNY